MSTTAAQDAALGVPIERTTYADGDAGIVGQSIPGICRRIREGMTTAVMQSVAANALLEAGSPEGVRRRSSAFLDLVRAKVLYAPDPLGTETIKSAQILLCVKGAPVCIPMGDCFPEGTLLLRKDGQLVPIEEIKVGDEIWGDKKWSRVEGKAFKGKLKVDAVEMNNGSTMYLTSDHKVYVGRCKHGKSVDCHSCHAGARVETFERIRIGDLQEGETLLQPERIAFSGHGGALPDQLDRLYVEGLAISEGWVDGNRFCISGQDGKRKETLKHEVKEICDRLGVPTSAHRKYIRVNDAEWATRVASFGHLARNKHFGALNLTEPEAAAVLRGIMSDSTANTRGQGRTFSTTSHTLMVQVRVLHRMFGRSTSVKMLTPEQHRGAGKHPLWRVGIRVKSDEHELSRSEKTLAVRGIERAVKKVPCWDIQTDDHKVYLPEHDVTVSNCDDLITCLGTLCAAAGMDVQVVRQDFGVDPTTGNKHQEHVLVEVLTEDGAWFALDPSSKTMPAGRKAPAQRETYHSPWDTAYGAPAQAEYIGMGAAQRENDGFGALPVFIWGHGWRRLPPTASIEDSMRNVGAGAIWEGAAMLQPQLDWLGQFWRVVDANGRSWSAATADAYQRALAKTWPADDARAQSDLLALVVSSSYQARAISTFPSHGQRAADALNRTWVVLLHRIGVRPENYDTKQLRAQLQKQGATQANIAVFDILVILAAAIGAAIIYATVFYFARDIINRALSLYETDRELARKHAEWEKIVDKHLADGTPFSDQELQKLKDLEDAQAGIIDKVIDTSGGKNTTNDFPWGMAIALGFVAAGTVVAVVYHKEIAEALSPAPKRKRLAA